jgi:hypothetical protein
VWKGGISPVRGRVREGRIALRLVREGRISLRLVREGVDSSTPCWQGKCGKGYADRVREEGKGTTL